MILPVTLDRPTVVLRFTIEGTLDLLNDGDELCGNPLSFFP